MLDKLKVINKALAILGEAPIKQVANLLDPTPSVEGAPGVNDKKSTILSMLQAIDDLIIEGLERQRFTFALKRFELAWVAPEFQAQQPWYSVAQLPADCIRVDHLEPNIRWYTIERNQILVPFGPLTNFNNFKIILVYQSATPEPRFSESFKNFLKYKLAQEYGRFFQANSEDILTFQNEAKENLERAAILNHLEAPNIPLQHNWVLQERFGGDIGFGYGGWGGGGWPPIN